MSRILTRMPSAKQIAARKAFARKYAKKGKRKAKSKKPKTSKRITEDMTANARNMLIEQQREPTRKEFKRAGYSESEIDDYFDRKWDKKMQEFLNKSNNES